MPLTAGNVRESDTADRAEGDPVPPEGMTNRHTLIRPESSWLLDMTEVWRFRELLWTLAGRDLKVRYKQTVLGVIWVIFQPLATALIFTFVFGRVLRIPFPGGVPALLFIFSALTGFYLFRDSVNRSSASLISNRNLVSKIYFPRVLLPVSGLLNALVDFAVALTVFVSIWVVLALTAGPEVTIPAPGWPLLLWPVCVVLIVMLSLGFGMAATALGVSWRDVGHVVPVILMILLYASPVMYDVGYLLDAPPAAATQDAAGLTAATSSAIPRWQKALYFSNPLAGLLSVYRWSLIGTGAVSWLAFAWSAACSVLMLIMGVLIFKRMERRFADVI